MSENEKTIYQKTVSWNERILLALNGTDKKKFWYTHKRVRELVADNEGILLADMPHSLSVYLLGLVKDGYVERAFKPAHMKDTNIPQAEYIYRSTGKPYVRPHRFAGRINTRIPVDHNYVELGFRIWNENKRLPKWFRRMMM